MTKANGYRSISEIAEVTEVHKKSMLADSLAR